MVSAASGVTTISTIEALGASSTCRVIVQADEPHNIETVNDHFSAAFGWTSDQALQHTLQLFNTGEAQATSSRKRKINHAAESFKQLLRLVKLRQCGSVQGICRTQAQREVSVDIATIPLANTPTAAVRYVLLDMTVVPAADIQAASTKAAAAACKKGGAGVVRAAAALDQRGRRRSQEMGRNRQPPPTAVRAAAAAAAAPPSQEILDVLGIFSLLAQGAPAPRPASPAETESDVAVTPPSATRRVGCNKRVARASPRSKKQTSDSDETEAHSDSSCGCTGAEHQPPCHSPPAATRTNSAV